MDQGRAPFASRPIGHAKTGWRHEQAVGAQPTGDRQGQSGVEPAGSGRSAGEDDPENRQTTGQRTGVHVAGRGGQFLAPEQPDQYPRQRPAQQDPQKVGRGQREAHGPHHRGDPENGLKRSMGRPRQGDQQLVGARLHLVEVAHSQQQWIMPQHALGSEQHSLLVSFHG